MRTIELVRRHWAATIVLATFFVLGIVYTIATPLFEKPDEIWHYPYVKYLADGQGLPVQDLARTQPLMRQESTQPPLYYATAALATFWIEDDDWQDLVWLNPFWGYNAPGTVNDNKNLILHTERERFPYRGAMLAIHVARLVSVLWGGIAVLATYLIALELFPKRRSFAVGAAALVAFNPQFIFISSAVSNDSAVSALCTLAVWLMLHLVRNAPMTKPQIRDSGWSLGIGHWVLLGLVLGLAILTKVSALALLPLAVIAIAMASWSERSVGAFLSKCAIVFGIVAIVAGWWYVLNWHLHGDPLGIWVHRQLVGPGRPRLTSSQLLHELSQLELSFWASFGMGNVHAHSWIYAVLRVAVRLGAVGLLIQSVNSEPRKFVNSWLRPTNPESTNLRLYQSLALLLLWGLLVFVALIRWLQFVFAPSGRHLFPAISSIAILLLLGLLQLIPSRLRAKAMALLTGAMFVFASVCPFVYIAPAYARPPLLSTKEIEAIPHRLDVNFGGMMQLLGYNWETGGLVDWETGKSVNSGFVNSESNPRIYESTNLRVYQSTSKPGDSLTITLYWQSLARINQDYAVFVHLLDENDLILAERNTFPGLGSFPTTLWQVGDAIADTYTLVLPETTYAPSSAQLEVGLFDLATGERLVVYGPGGEAVDDNVRFHQIEVVPRSETSLPNPVHFNFGGKIALVGYEVDRRKAEPGEAIHLTLYWQGLANTEDNYTVFVHLLREEDQIWARVDRQPQAHTSTWSKGQTVVDEYELVTPPDAPPDVYEIEVGLYLPETGDRLDILDQDGRPMGNRVLLSKVRVE